MSTEGRPTGSKGESSNFTPLAIFPGIECSSLMSQTLKTLIYEPLLWIDFKSFNKKFSLVGIQSMIKVAFQVSQKKMDCNYDVGWNSQLEKI